MKTPKTPPRPQPDPNHHLWKNGNLYWLAATVHRPDWTSERVRESLRTPDIEEARRRRDERLAEIAAEPGTSLALRFREAGARRRPRLMEVPPLEEPILSQEECWAVVFRLAVERAVKEQELRKSRGAEDMVPQEPPPKIVAFPKPPLSPDPR